jgi:hypothetical protein
VVGVPADRDDDRVLLRPALAAVEVLTDLRFYESGIREGGFGGARVPGRLSGIFNCVIMAY